ncbi:hypothetical protein AOXY_G29761 [Acipenser oxyrinchus oxyrinchus]|uniref:Uncharacterized protein n=1 Tax=Acipenser oxyrinchus oxyrinchus TaxID=40147 RepID=A0AAD8CQ48_ACIOX|nr:hypothetical protein AOXY_G29761 [Acipenser oxyrinchus oxyrinchus]
MKTNAYKYIRCTKYLHTSLQKHIKTQRHSCSLPGLKTSIKRRNPDNCGTSDLQNTKTGIQGKEETQPPNMSKNPARVDDKQNNRKEEKGGSGGQIGSGALAGAAGEAAREVLKAAGNIPKAANILKAGGAGAVAGAVATAVATSPAVKEMCDKTGKKVKATVEGAAAEGVDRTRNINETLIQENSPFQ